MGSDREKGDDLHGWGPMLESLDRRRRRSHEMGGAEKLERQRSRGLLNARERIRELLDADSFSEIGSLVGGVSEPDAPADAFPAGFGRVDGRPVLVGAEDFTVKGGSIGLGAADKRYRLTQLAAEERVPLIFMLHGAGHRITNALKGHGRGPNDLQGLVDLSGVVPTVCLVLGPSAGHSALAAPLMDFAVMTKSAALFAAGPPLVEAAIGEKVSKEELGGPEVHGIASGVVHNVVEDDRAAVALARQYLAHLPSNAWSGPPRIDTGDTGERPLHDILSIIPCDSRRPYKMRRVLERLVDAHSLLEIQPRYGAALITALARLGGRSVAIVANDPMAKAGTLDRAAAEKGARFLEVMGSFHLPVVFLADNPGMMAGKAAEREGALRAAARMFAAQRRLRSPKLHVTLRKAFGFGSSMMAMNPFDRQTLSLAFPGATLGAMPAEGGGMAAGAAAEQQAALDAAEAGGPWRIADSMGFDEIIDPREMRDALLRGLALGDARASLGSAPLGRFGPLP